MTDHEHADAISLAARWLACEGKPERPVVVELRHRFGLSPVEACAAIREANHIRHSAAQEGSAGSKVNDEPRR